MEAKISSNVKRLIELDQKSVALEKEWNNRLEALEQDFKSEMEEISGTLQDAREEAKKIYSQLLEKAQAEAAALALDAEHRIGAVEQSLARSVDGLAGELWDKIKDELK